MTTTSTATTPTIRKKRTPKASGLKSYCNRPPVPILCIDQSYTNTGIALIGDDQHKYGGQALFWTNLLFTSYHKKWQKRMTLHEQLTKILKEYKPRSVVIEGVDFHRDGALRATVSNVLMTISTCVIDTVKEYDQNIEVYSLRTIDWKRAILRTPEERKGKQGTMDLMTALIGAPITDDNISDALGIGFAAYQSPHLLKRANI